MRSKLPKLKGVKARVDAARPMTYEYAVLRHPTDFTQKDERHVFEKGLLLG